MSASEWEDRYQTGDMPWEKGEPSPGLVDFLSTHPDLSKGSVLVPGCGTGHDARTWARAGFDVTGVDLAPSGIRIAREKTLAAGLEAKFVQADFLGDDLRRQFDWLFEHTLFCAIDPTRRDDYVRAAYRGLKPTGQLLAVYYLIPDEDGPPFGTTREEVRQRFDPLFEPLGDWVPRSYPNRAGLEWMVWWKRRSPA